MRTIYRLLFQREFNTDLYNENHLSSSFSERVQYWSIQWEPFIVFFFRESSILIYIMRTIYRLLFQREFNTDLYNENHLSSSFSERVQYWSIQWEPFIVFFFRESSILIYINENHLSSSFSERVQYWSIQWEPFIVFFFRESSILIYIMRTIYLFFFRESSILIYTMRTIYLLLFQREFNTDLYNENHLSSSFSERVQYWSIQWEPFIVLLFQREFNTDLYNENHLSSSFSERVQYWSIQWEPFIVFFFRESSILIYTMRTIYRLLFQREFNTDLYNENHLSSSFSERVQYWSIQWEPFIVFFFRESSILIYTMRTIYLLLFQREFNTDLYNENHLSSSFSERVQYWSIQWEPFIVFFFRESSILIYTMRTIYRLLFQREFNTDLYNENHLSSSFSERVQYWSIQWEPFIERVQYWSIQWEPFIVFFFRESSILIYTMRTIYLLLFQREFNTDLYNENHLSSSFSERVQYWSILWEPFIVFFFRESSILIYTMRTIYRLLFQREFNTDLYNENHLSSSFSERVQYWSIQWEPFIVFFFRESSILIYTMRTIYRLLFQREFNTDLYNENHLSSSFSERVQYWSIQWEPFIVFFFRESSILIYIENHLSLLFQREFNTDLYYENHLSSSFSERVQYWSIQWEPFISFFFRESSILIYTMRTIYRLLFQREFNTDLYNENHLSSSFSERVQYWSIQWEPFIVFFFRESSILIYTMRTILLFQREFNTDLYNENHLSSSFSERVQYWSIQWEPFIVFFFRESSILIYTMRTIYRLLFQREFNTDLYNENHLSSSFSERVQYWSIQWEPFIVFFFRESSILIYTMRTIYRLLFQREFNTDLYYENHLSLLFQREFNTDLYNEREFNTDHLSREFNTDLYWEPFISFFFRESSILIYTMRTIYRLLFQREFNTDLYNENHLSSSFSERVQYWSIQWEPFIVFFFRESSILIYTMITNIRLYSQREFNTDLYNSILIYIMRTIYLFFFRESSILIYTMRTIYLLLFQREFNTDLYNENHLSSSFSERVQYWSIQWEPFIVFFFRESSILIYTMRTIYRLLFQREFNTDLYNENHLSSSFSERVQYWSIQWEPFIVFFFRESSILIYTFIVFFFRESSILIYTMRTIYRLLFQREFNTDLYNENHLSSSFSERVQYWSIQWEPFIVFFFRESSILIYTMRTIYLPSFSERVQYWSIQWEPFIVFFFRESSILIYTMIERVQLMRTIYRLLFQREFNTDILRTIYRSISIWEPFIVFFFRESSILIYTMRTIYRLLFQREFNTDLYNENHLSSSFSERV